MLPNELIVPTLQRIEDVLGDLDAVEWELGQIVGNPKLPWYLRPEAERKAAQAQTMLSQVRPLVQETMRPFAQEHAVLKAAQEAVLRASRERCVEETGQEMPGLLKTEAAVSPLAENDQKAIEAQQGTEPKGSMSSAHDERGGYLLSIGQRVQSDQAREIAHSLAHIPLMEADGHD